jgi:hypothetical protein
VTALRGNSTLTTLVLTGNEVGGSIVVAVNALLEVRKNLRSLTLTTSAPSLPLHSHACAHSHTSRAAVSLHFVIPTMYTNSISTIGQILAVGVG